MCIWVLVVPERMCVCVSGHGQCRGRVIETIDLAMMIRTIQDKILCVCLRSGNVQWPS